MKDTKPASRSRISSPEDPERRPKKFVKRLKRLAPAGEAARDLLLGLGGKERLHLAALWENWDMAMGPDIAALALPLGHKEGTLNIGAEDTMAMQELSLQSDDILERANAFMDSPFFNRVRVILLHGQRTLDVIRPQRPLLPPPPKLPPRPPRLGSLLGKLDPASPVGRCYEAYLAMFRDRG